MKALIVDNIHPEGIRLPEKYCSVDIKDGITASEFEQVASNYDIVIGRATPSTPRIEYPLLENSGKLKVIGIASVGLDQFDMKYIESKGVKLINLPGVNSISVAEHAFAMMLSVMRRIPVGYEEMKQGLWNKHGYTEAVELRSKKLGIIGFGNIGKAMADIALHGFKMDVQAYDPYVDDEEFASKGVKRTTLEGLITEPDIVTIHAPLTDETYHMSGEEELKKMKKGSGIINTGRGGIIDETALYDVLHSQHLAFAALDVQETEPCYDSPLFELPNFIATPHIAGLTADALERAGIEVVKQTLAELGVQVDSKILT